MCVKYNIKMDIAIFIRFINRQNNERDNNPTLNLKDKILFFK